MASNAAGETSVVAELHVGDIKRRPGMQTSSRKYNQRDDLAKMNEQNLVSVNTEPWCELPLVREYNVLDASTILLIFLFCYPFLVTSALVLHDSATAFMTTR